MSHRVCDKFYRGDGRCGVVKEERKRGSGVDSTCWTLFLAAPSSCESPLGPLSLC